MRLLIWGEKLNGGPYDIFRRLDYNCIYKELVYNYNANTTNIGNKVWIQGIVSCLSTEENQISFLDVTETWEQINSKYDAIIYSAANLLSIDYKTVIAEISQIFKKSRIPIYVISVGAQAEDYSCLDFLVSNIKYETKDFVETIYSTGGEIACRGYFTKMVLDQVINNTASVVGCPSLFQNGCNISIQKMQEPVCPVFNGLLINDKELFEEYPNSAFIDQDQWIKECYDVSSYDISSVKVLRTLIERKGEFETRLFLSNRIKLFYDVPDWKRFLQQSRFNFSCGTRIHGNIMALLSGIPAMVLTVDTRTQEMAEYYEIPYEKYEKKHFDVAELYHKLDYNIFNKNYKEKFRKFESFLVNHNLVKKMNQENLFWNKPVPNPIDSIEKKKRQALSVYNFMNYWGGFGKKVFYKSTNRFIDSIEYEPIYTKEQYKYFEK